MPDVWIRQLGPADRDGWAGLRHALWPHASLAELSEELDGMLQGDFAGFGAFDGDVLIGFAEASERAYGDGCDTSPVAWLEGIYVTPLRRRDGIGRRLVEAVAAWGRSRGRTELGSDAAIDNLPSRLSHALWGFEETERVVMMRRML